jgi:Ca2+-binding EF-hand superfamily protein
MMSILQKTRNTDARKELREIFSAIDTDSNGFIDSEELRIAMRLLMFGNDDMRLTKEEIDEMIAEVDGDKDGRLTFDGDLIDQLIEIAFFSLFRICCYLRRTDVILRDPVTSIEKVLNEF